MPPPAKRQDGRACGNGMEGSIHRIERARPTPSGSVQLNPMSFFAIGQTRNCCARFKTAAAEKLTAVVASFSQGLHVMESPMTERFRLVRPSTTRFLATLLIALTALDVQSAPAQDQKPGDSKQSQIGEAIKKSLQRHQVATLLLRRQRHAHRQFLTTVQTLAAARRRCCSA
jgi:hypothetical protein